MKRKTSKRMRRGRIVLAMVAAASTGVPWASADVQYTLTDLGAYSNPAGFAAGGINDFGEVAIGTKLFSGGAAITLGGGAIAFDINNSAQVTGVKSSHAFIYTAGVTQDIGTLGTLSNGRSINASAQVAGWSNVSGNERAFRYSGGVMSDLGTFGDDNSAAFAINDTGQVAGYADIPGNASFGFLWTSGAVDGEPGNPQMKRLYPISGKSQCEARAINNSGLCVGTSYTSRFGDTSATLWDTSSASFPLAIDLGTLGGQYSEAFGLNDGGQVTGWADIVGDTDHAFRYSGGVMSDLNSLIPAGSGWILAKGYDINNVGQIVGQGTLNGVSHAFLLNPAGVWLGGSGNWSDSAKWGASVIPNSASLDVYINHGIAAAGTTTLDQNAIVRSITVGAGDSLTISSGRTLTVAANGTTANRISSLSIAGGKLDLSNNKLITQTSPGSWNGSAYTGMTGMIQSGRNGGTWDGGGIITSQSKALSPNLPRTTIGIARGSQVIASSASATALWGGQTITGTDTLVMYTYAGDANLDGKLDADDYGRIDTNIALSVNSRVKAWANGDFNYDGVIDIGDYGLLDTNIALHSTGSGAGGLSVVPVPEPDIGGTILVAALAIRRRRAR